MSSCPKSPGAKCGAAIKYAGNPVQRPGVSYALTPAAGADCRNAIAAPLGRLLVEDEEGIRFDYAPPSVETRRLVRDGMICIEGEITSSDCSATLVREALAELPKGQPITVLINTNGGHIAVAHAIFTALKIDARKITIRILDQAWSCGALIAMAGDRIEIGPLGSIGIHCARFQDIGTATAVRLRGMVDDLDEADAVQLDIFASRLRYSRGWILQAMLSNRAWVGEDAVAAGITDVLIDDPRMMERPNA